MCSKKAFFCAKEIDHTNSPLSPPPTQGDNTLSTFAREKDSSFFFLFHRPGFDPQDKDFLNPPVRVFECDLFTAVLYYFSSSYIITNPSPPLPAGDPKEKRFQRNKKPAGLSKIYIFLPFSCFSSNLQIFFSPLDPVS